MKKNSINIKIFQKSLIIFVLGNHDCLMLGSVFLGLVCSSMCWILLELMKIRAWAEMSHGKWAKMVSPPN